MFDARRRRTETVPDFLLQRPDLVQVRGRGNPLIQAEPHVDGWDVSFGDADLHPKVDLAPDLLDLPALELLDRLLQQMDEVVVSDGFHRPVLLLSEQMAGAADFQVFHRQPESGSELAEFLDGFEALAGDRSQLGERRNEKIGEGLAGRPADPAAQLVELGQAEMIGPLDDQGVDQRDVDSVLDDRRRDQDVVLLVDEIDHLHFELGRSHPAVDHGQAGVRDPFPDFRRQGVHLLDLVEDIIDLPPAGDLLLDRGRDQARGERRHDRVNGQPVLGRRFDQADVAEAGQGQVKGPGDRRGRQRQDVDAGLEVLDFFLVGDSEPLLLIDDQQTQVAESHVGRKETVGSDDDVDAAVLQILDDPAPFGGRLEPGQGGDPDREQNHPPGERLVMLAGQDGRGAKDGDLLAVHHRLEGGPDGDLRLSIADVAAKQPVHGRGRLHIRLDLLDGAELVLGFLELEGFFKLVLPAALRAESESLDGFAPGVKIQELLGQLLDGFFRPFLGFQPMAGSELVQQRLAGPDGRVFLDEAQVLDRDEQRVSVPVAELHELRRPVLDIHFDQPPEHAHSVIGVDDEVSGLQVLELGDRGPGRGPGGDDPFLGEDVLLGEEMDLLPRIAEAPLEIAQAKTDLAAGGLRKRRFRFERGDLLGFEKGPDLLPHRRRG